MYNEKLEKCQSVLLSWKIYDDNDLEKYDNRSLMERFTRTKGNLCVVKSIIRGELNNLIIPNSHISGINVKNFCNSEGERVFPNSFMNIKCKSNSMSYLKHFYSKTLEELCKKIKRGDAHFNKNNPKYESIIYGKLEIFFSINKITKTKIKKLEKCLNLNLDKYFQRNIK